MNDLQYRLAMRMLDIVERSMLDKKHEAVYDVVKEPEPVQDETFLDPSIDSQLSEAMDSVLTAKE